MTAVRIEVDTPRCEGHGLCEQAAPDLFALDDDGVVQVAAPHVDEARRPAAEAGVRACPVAALRLVT